MPQPIFALVQKRASASLIRFRDDERGSMTLIIVFMFLVMVMFGGIAVDVMRYETRRVTLQQTLDRAALAAASLQQNRTPQAIVDDWFAKSGILQDGMDFVEFTAATVGGQFDEGLRRVTVDASVFSQNFFMSWYSDRDYFQSQLRTEAAQGVSQIEVMLVLDITGSMNESLGGGGTKIAGLRAAAGTFVDLLKQSDSQNGVSIGVVPYAAQVNIPFQLRDQFTVLDKSTWLQVANTGVPFINCIEIPTSTFNSTGLSQTSQMRMGAVADANSTTTTNGNYATPASNTPVITSRNCTTRVDNAATAFNESTYNHVVLPSKSGTPAKNRIANLVADGNTNIAMGMRWGVALIDEAARPIYTAIGDASVAGRPADNDNELTRKIIVLMTDGDHVTNTHVRDGYKAGASPIWRGQDGNYAIRFINPASPAAPIRPGSGTSAALSCSGWQLANYATREYFVPHLKRNSVAQKNGNQAEGAGTGASTAGACDPLAWLATPAWPGSGTARRLDWSEVWAAVRVSWVAQQLYARSGVTGMSYTNAMNNMRANYLTNDANMDALLQQSCTAAKAAGIEVYSIAFSAPAQGEAALNGCASLPKSNYFYDAANNADLMAAFAKIATDISDLRLTQ